MSDAPVPIRLIVVDDHTLVREGIRHILEEAPGFAVVGEAGTGEEALKLAAACRPDVVVMDISLPGESGLTIAATIRRELPETRVLILSVHDHAEYVLQSVRAGAHGYLRKDTLPSELREAVRAIHRGESFFSPPVARQLSAALRGETQRDSRAERLAALSGREREVLVGVAGGATNKEIAGRLGLSVRTIETYRESLMRKLEIRTVAGLTRFALDTGLVKQE